MERKEIIDGLKDLIKDRESFITEGEPESWKTDTDKIFEHDKQVLEEAINTIEAQQQEIDRLEVQVEADKDLIRELNNSYINSELNLSALISDKDEQARKTRQLEEGLRSTLKVLETLNYRGGLGLDIHKWLRDEMQTVNALLGGKEDA